MECRTDGSTRSLIQPLHQCIYSALFVLNCDLFNFGVGGFVAMVEVVFAISAF